MIVKYWGGQTLGKKIFNIKTINREGEGIPLSLSFLRTLVIFLFLYIFEITPILISNADVGNFIFSIVVISVCFAYLVTNIIMVVLHPLKRGFQDIITDSFVIKVSQLEKLNETLSNTEQYNRKIQHSYRLCTAVFVIMILLVGYQNAIQYRKEKHNLQEKEILTKKIKDTFKLENVSLGVVNVRESDESTTATLQKNASNSKEEQTAPLVKKVFVARIVEYKKNNPETMKYDEETKKLADDLKRFIFDNYKGNEKISNVYIFFSGVFDILFYSNSIDFTYDKVENKTEDSKKSEK